MEIDDFVACTKTFGANVTRMALHDMIHSAVTLHGLTPALQRAFDRVAERLRTAALRNPEFAWSERLRLPRLRRGVSMALMPAITLLPIPTLGPAKIPSPLLSRAGHTEVGYVSDDERVLFDPSGAEPDLKFELAGPREKVFFQGSDVAAGIVTCGGTCPGMNNVIRGLVLQLWHAYGVRRILGFRYGFLGLGKKPFVPAMALDPDVVQDKDLVGGTFLGSSRGPLAATEMADTLEALGIRILFGIGGDGTMRGLYELYRELVRRGSKIGIVGVPKTVDNDLLYIERTFGFETAVSIAAQAIRAAHVEATGFPNGIGLVHLMGRNSGFIAASATLATREVNLVLVPEVPFDLDGEWGILGYLRERIKNRGHAVVVVAEGAGQDHLPARGEKDPSGNPKLGDIGAFLKETLVRELKDLEISLKYIDPSYIVRAAAANSGDSLFCGQLAAEAAHAGLAGKTGVVIGLWLNHFTHVPLASVAAGKKYINPGSAFWRSVLDSTGQPRTLKA